MQQLQRPAIRRRLIPLAALLLATALGGCIAYTGYPPSSYGYSYSGGYYASYPSGYYASYPETYTNAPAYRPYYSPAYYGQYNYENNNGG